MKMNRLPLLAMLFLVACQFTPEAGKITESGDFDYRTTQDVSVEISFRDASNTQMKNVPVVVALSNGFEADSSVIAQTSTGPTGVASINTNMATAQDSLFVRVSYAGLPDYWKVAINNGRVNWSEATPYNGPQLVSKEKAEGGRVAGYPYSIATLGTWNSSGLPNYLESTQDIVDQGLMARINESLPESRPVPTYNPEYLTSTDKSLKLNDLADVWVTFVHEGAGYLNTLGFYVYDQNNPPQTASDISKVTIIFPNVSFQGSGGALKSGYKVNIGRFAAGKAIGWVLFSNAFSNGTVGNGYWALYSNQILNTAASDPAKRQQNILFNDVGFNRIVLGFEDISRNNSGCDNDFNDAIFYITTNPVTAASVEDMPALDIPVDADGDGVTDQYDLYPLDPNKAYNQYSPSAGVFNTISYEDLWPSRGDYDFNDLVMGYNVHQVLNASNQVVQLNMSYELRAIGGVNEIGFGVHLPVAQSKAKSITVSPSGRHSQLLNSNGSEQGQTQIVVPLFDDAHSVIQRSAGSFTNTESYTGYVSPVKFSVTVDFTSGVSTTTLGSAPFDSFIYVNGRDVEVHLPDKAPTDKMNMSLLGTSGDNSRPSQGKYYQTYDGKPWALIVPGTFDYPEEKQSIESAYNYFKDWATSKGTQRKDWYLSTSGYRNANKLYRKN